MPSSHRPLVTRPLVIGLDAGSTTVKAVVVDAATRQIVWHDYRRHHTKQAEHALGLLTAASAALPEAALQGARVFVTGSGAGPLCALLGAVFVQEVNAVTLAVEALHPDAGSVIELGGQDAKIIIFKKNERTGETSASFSMNDKCASGTGATIDKCLIKVGLPAQTVRGLVFDGSRLHHVAAKCGVFAETDIVNLVKSGIPSEEIMCSLADAIVMQNLSVLTRGNTLRAKVLLLGGPNTYLPFLVDCWRKRIPETWNERGYAYPKDVPLEQLIVVPQNAELYAAYGAAVYGLHEPDSVGVFAGLEGLRTYIQTGRAAQLGKHAGPPLVRDAQELTQFLARYERAPFVEPSFEPGQHVRAVLGVDGGSTSSKAVLLSESGEVLRKAYVLSKGNPIQDTKDLLRELRARVAASGATLDIVGFGATGYAAAVLEECVCADANVVETVAHALSAVHYFGPVDVICDIGGQDIKVLFMEHGAIKSFKLSNQCSAGNGMLLQAMADQLGIGVADYAAHAFRAPLAPKFNYGCAVFLDTDRVSFQKEGFGKEELLAGLAQVLPKNVWQYVVAAPRLAQFGKRFVLQGGTQYNLAAVKAQVDYIEARVPDAEVWVHPHCGEAGAIGAAMEALRVVSRRGTSRFIGLDAAIELSYETRNDDTTRCKFCQNHCSRTFIDAHRPDGSRSRYISGFACEKGQVESQSEMRALVARRKQLMERHPNLVAYEARRAFESVPGARALPHESTVVHETVSSRRFWGGTRSERLTRHFQRSHAQRAQFRVAMPRALNLYSTAPFFRTYFEVLGVAPENVVFSSVSGEDMWSEGGKYGSVDPCFPSKVVQAHIHQLLFKVHAQTPLNAIFFPILTHVPSFLKNTLDHATCPVAAGTPNVIKAAFTKEQDYFAQRGIHYLDPALSFAEPVRLKQRLYEAWKDLLELTEDESDFAVDEALAALERFDLDVQAQGKRVLEQVAAEDGLAILVIGRPYHLDPGLHHGIPDEFQLHGYPVLSIRSIPKDEAWLARYFAPDLASGSMRTPLEIADVWPESYSANSAMKVWAAKFAARHPNVVLLDLSSFKCGHDAPTYGIIDGISERAALPRLALHEIDGNKPGGSLQIRVKTYVHALEAYRERQVELADARRALAHSLQEKRAELLRARQAQAHDRQ